MEPIVDLKIRGSSSPTSSEKEGEHAHFSEKEREHSAHLVMQKEGETDPKSLSNLELARMYAMNGNESKFNMFFGLMKFEYNKCNHVNRNSEVLNCHVTGN